MIADTADTTDVDGVPDDLDYFDPAVHTDPDTVVLVVLNSTSGRTLRQADPVHMVRRSIAEFLRRELDAGHGPASRTACLAEAERRRWAAHVVDGREDEFVPAEFDERDGDDDVMSWPDLADVTDATSKEV